MSPTAQQQPAAATPAVRRIFLAVAVVVVLLCGYLAFRILSPQHRTGADPSNDIPDLVAVKTFDHVGNEHTTDAVTYPETPPAGGPHDPAWEDCGVYSEQVRNENAVHSLEHGTVWITYRPDTPAADVQTLASALDSVKDKKTILSPYAGLPAPVVVTVWNAQLDLKGAHDPRLQDFLDFYGDGHTAPEAAMASCAGGVHNYATADSP